MSIQTNFPAIKPSLLLDFANTKTLDPRITFTRASTATYYNGVTTAKAEQNLFTYSQELDNAAWQVGSATVTANTTAAPDGTTTAETLTAIASTARHSIFRAAGTFPTVSGSAYMVSFFVKANTNNFVQIILQLQSADFANFNLSTGALGTTGGTGSSATITSVGNSWYRITMPYTAGGTDRDPALVIISSATAARGESWTTVGTESVYVWGAQIEIRSSVTAYTATTTQAITNYIPQLMTAAAGVPRFDCNPTTDESLGLLIEEQRTNLLTYSEQFDNAAWTKTTISATANNVVSPDGTVDGDTLTADGTTNSHDVLQSATVTGAMTCSVYVKKATARYVYLVLNSTATGTDYSSVSFDLDSAMAGTVVNSGNFTGGAATITSVGNSWYRLTLSASTSATTNYIFVGVSSGLSPSLVPRGRVSFATSDSFRIWGAQLEAGAFATSYIPTVASQVTRSADAASMTGTNFSSWYNQAEGTLYAESLFNSGSITTDQSIIAVDANTNGYRNKISRYNGSVYGTTTNGSAQADIGLGSASSQNTLYKSSYVYKTNDFSGTVNSGTVATDSSGTVPTGLSQALIGKSASGEYLNGTIKKIAYYPLRVTNANLQALTS